MNDEPGLTVSIRPGANDKYAEADAFETFSEIFEGERREVRASMDAIVGALGLAAGQTVADIGAGTGLFLPALARAVGDDGRVVAVDISPVFLEGLRVKVADDPGLGVVQVHAATPRELGLPPRSLDAVLMCDVYHHVEFPFAYMPTVAEALVDGGELVLVDFERIEGVTSPAMMEHVRADKQTVMRELERAGFELVEELDLGLRENYALRLRPRRPGSGEGAAGVAGAG